MSKMNFQTPLFEQFSELQLCIMHKIDAFYKPFEYAHTDNHLNPNYNAQKP